MFSKEVGALDQLANSGANEQLIDVLRFLLGNCQAELEHRGQVKILGSRQENATDAVLEVANYPIPPEHNGTASPNNGAALLVAAGLAQFNGPVNGVIGWAVARANWINLPGNGCNVNCVIVKDKDGTSLSTPEETITIYLPRNGTSRDPNVQKDNVIQYLTDAGGEASCPWSLDDPIGTVKMWNSATIPQGWQLCDGSNSTVDMRDRLPVGYDSAGTHSIIGATNVSAGSITGTTILIATSSQPDTVLQETTVGSIIILPHTNTDSGTDGQDFDNYVGHLDHNRGYYPQHTIYYSDIAARLQVPAHSHNFQSDAIAGELSLSGVLPARTTVVFIQRVD